MAELLYGESVDWVALAQEAKLDPWLVKNILTTHASSADLKAASVAKVPDNVVPIRGHFPRKSLQREDALEG
ncbi:MAG TPA: hypothetical protein VKR05_04315 [Candidatus Cybelea sp.]|nr:hypothetical protein [Candidatus Cybelea sp.]